MQALTPYQQRELYNNVKRLLKYFEQNTSADQWVPISKAMEITGLKKRAIQYKAAQGIFNIQRTGKQTRYYVPDLQFFANQNSTTNILT